MGSNNYLNDLDGLVFTLLDDGTYSVNIKKSKMRFVMQVPSVYAGKPVSAIAENGFADCTFLEKVVVFDGSKSTGSISEESNEDKPREHENLTILFLPSSITKIGKNAFKECINLRNVTVQAGVKIIDECAFTDCKRLTSVLFEERSQLASIGKRAFYNCKSLESINIPESVRSVGHSAFDGCVSLDSVYIKDMAKWCEILFDNYSANPLFNAKNLYLKGELLKELVIPDGVKSICNYAFNSCTSITSVIIPDSVRSIGLNAFFECEKIASVILGKRVKIIGDFAFACGNIKSIKIPKSVKKIGEEAFGGYYNLKIFCEARYKPLGWNRGWKSSSDIAIWNCNGALDRLYLVIDAVRYSIKDGVAIVNDVPKNATEINIPTSVTYKKNTYSVTDIGEKAFFDCENLTEVTIPNSVTSIGDSAFMDCSSLTDIYYTGTEEEWNNISVAFSEDSYPANVIIHYNCLKR